MAYFNDIQQRLKNTPLYNDQGEVWNPQRQQWMSGQTEMDLRRQSALFRMQTPPLQVNLPDQNYQLPMMWLRPDQPKKGTLI